MSKLNNKNTLFHYSGSVWLSRPDPALQASGQPQSVQVCIQSGEEFSAVDLLELAPGGVYSKGRKTLGRLYDESFNRYISRLAGYQGRGAAETAAQVCDAYRETGSMAKTARRLGLPEQRVKRILIGKGLYTSPQVEQVLWLYDEGRGHPVAEIARMLNVSEDTVRACLPDDTGRD